MNTDLNINLTLPDWINDTLKTFPDYFLSYEEQIKFTIHLAKLNIEHQTGGPFAAAIFEKESGKLISVGVNRVVPLNCSTAHAEIMAIMFAQKNLKTFDLGNKNLPEMTLAVNWRPCAMCFGSLFWAGIKNLIIAGSGNEMELITGFDEGPIHPDWRNECKIRGINLTENICKEETLEVFKFFSKSGQPVYNGS